MTGSALPHPPRFVFPHPPLPPNHGYDSLPRERKMVASCKLSHCGRDRSVPGPLSQAVCDPCAPGTLSIDFRSWHRNGPTNMTTLPIRLCRTRACGCCCLIRAIRPQARFCHCGTPYPSKALPCHCPRRPVLSLLPPSSVPHLTSHCHSPTSPHLPPFSPVPDFGLATRRTPGRVPRCH